MRVAVAGFQHESNTFLDGVTPASAFEKGSIYGPLVRGDDLLAFARNGNPVPLTGFLRGCERRGWTPLPASWCFGEPGARVEGAGFEAVAGEIEARIEALRPFDAIYLDLHGALVAEGFDDGEGELIARLRRHFGPDMPIVASLDLHGNVTDLMVESASFLVAYRTYPHIDMEATGERAAAGLAAICERGAMQASHVKLPFLIPIHKQTTFAEPMKGVYDRLDALEQAGAFAVVIEGVPEPLGRAITEAIDIPTIGIGASPACDGQILVTDDMLGLFSDFTPKFVKRFATLGASVEAAVTSYAAEVTARRFPGPEHCFGAARPGKAS